MAEKLAKAAVKRSKQTESVDSKPAQKEEPVVTAEQPVQESKEVKKEAPKPKTAKATGSDKLTKIEGVGPKLSEILSEAGFDSFEKIANASADQLREVLANAGNRYKAFDPTTWPQQASLANDGKWDELKTLQDNLKGGK